jgi:hypothetical protein
MFRVPGQIRFSFDNFFVFNYSVRDTTTLPACCDRIAIDDKFKFFEEYLKNTSVQSS